VTIDPSRLREDIRAEARQWPLPQSAPAREPDAGSLPLDHPQRDRYRLDELVHVHGEAFVERAYRCVLKRAPDAAALLATLERLLRGDSKIAILGDLRQSAEGRRHAVRIEGLRLRYAFWRMTQWPLLGGLIERTVLIAELPAIAREQRRLGQLMQQNEVDSAEIVALRAEVAELRRRLGVGG
jgi:hypothetical protein